MNLGWRLAAVFAIQALVLVYMLVDRHWLREAGRPIVLETLPIDPRSLFSGDHVRLNYSINHLSLDKIEGDKEFRAHQTVYVVLRRAEPYWEVVSIHTSAPKFLSASSAEQVMLRGEVVQANAQRRLIDTRVVHVRYGIEAYFIPEGEGRTIERPAPGETVSMRVAVDAGGRAAIQALLVNGNERFAEQLF